MATLLVGPARPYTTIQAAINVTSATNDNPASRAAMDLILVDPGTYNETLDLRTGWLLPLIIRAADPANRPVITSTGANQAVRADSVYRGTAVGELTLDDLIFSGWTNASNGVIYITTSGIIVRRCKFTGCTNRIPIRTVRGSATRYGIVDSCEFLTSGLTTGLILGDSAYTDVINCKAVCPTNVPFYSDLGGASRNIEHNSILGTWNSGGNTDVITVTGGTARGNVVQNLGTGGRYGIYEWGAGAYTENVFYGTFSTRFFGTDGGGNQNADPLFTNTATGDLTLQAGSPGIRSLSRSANTLLTILGGSRSDPTDAGAYERALATTVTGATVPSSTTVKLALAALMANDATWTTTGNYTITPPGGAPAITVSAAAVTDAGMSITLTMNEMLQGGSYTVAWAGLTNITSGSTGFTGVGVVPTLQTTTATGENTVRVTFSEAMSTTNLETTAKYTVAPTTAGGPAITVSSVVREGGASPTYVDVTISNAVAGKGYTLSIASGLTDQGGNVLAPTSGTFTSPSTTVASVARTAASVTLTLTRPVLTTASLTTSGNYGITGTAAVTVSSAAVNDPTIASTVTLTTTEHTQGASYTAAWAGLTSVTNGSLGYTGVGVAPTLGSATVTTNQLIRLNFSEAMSATGLSTAGNYTVAPVSPGGPAITVSSATPGGGNTYVDLVISLGLAGKQYTVTASAALTDSAGNAIGTRAANYTLQKATLLSMTRMINTLVITLSAASDPNALTTLGTWTIARRAPLFGVTPTVSAVALDSPTAPTVVTLTTTNHTNGQNYRVTVASTTGVSAGHLDYTGVGVEVTVTVDGFYLPNNTTVAVWDEDTEDWVSALSVTIVSDLQVTAVLPYYAPGTVTQVRVSAGTRHGYKSFTYP